MSETKPPLTKAARDWFREQGRKGGELGGSKGGKASLVKMTKAARIARARTAALAKAEKQAPDVMERAKQIVKLRAAGKTMEEAAAAVGVSTSNAYRLARIAKEKGS